ncbi:MAG TPA: hypothetical protein VF017_04825 [Thermoanaerobaculia bacterium]|nr:hypothetical protein [Thermoanaerobaculia bacterium]
MRHFLAGLELPGDRGASSPLEVGGEAIASPPGVSEVLLQPRPFVVAALPLRREDAVREVTRTARTGRSSWLRVTYQATDPRFPLPFGADRSLLAWITTKAFQDGAVRFSAITEYFRAFGLDQGGRAYRVFRERFERVARLAIQIEEIDQEERRTRRLVLMPEAVEPLELLNGGSRAGQLADRRLLAYHRYGFDLDPDFWRYLRETRVPTPLSALRPFHHRPLAWDFTQLLLWRCYAARSAAVVPFGQLCAQLGSQEKDPRRLRYRLGQILAELREHHPELPARLLPRSGDLVVEPWKGPGRPAKPGEAPARPGWSAPAPAQAPARERPASPPRLPEPSPKPLPRPAPSPAKPAEPALVDPASLAPLTDPRERWRQLRLALRQVPPRPQRANPHPLGRARQAAASSSEDSARPPPGS